MERAEVMKTIIVPRTDANGNTTEVEQQVPEIRSNTFFSETLDSQLKSLGTPSSEGYTKIDIGEKEAQFKFVLDGGKELSESYSGKSVNITYRLIARVDKKPFWAIDANQEIQFKVVDKNSSLPSELNPIRVENTDDFVTLTMEVENDKFLRGDTVKGKITLSNPRKKAIHSVQVSIRGIEIASIDNLPPVENTIENYTTSLDGKWNDGDIMPFELKVPLNAMVSYTGVYSKHSWDISAKVDVVFNLDKDLYTSHAISIV
jgi:hypothetical protein